MNHAESKLQIAVSTWAKFQYPNLYFTSESSGIPVSQAQAGIMKACRSKHKHLDMIFSEPKGPFHGLFLELKKDHDELYTKKGEIRDNKHVQEQWASIKLMSSKGYYATFACGIDEAMQIINDYMKLK